MNIMTSTDTYPSTFPQRMKRAGITAALCLFLSCALHTVSHAQIAVKADTLYTMEGNGQPIQNGVVLIKDGKIEAVGRAGSIRIPEDYTLYETSVATPGLIDAHSVVGLAGIFNQDHDQDQLETSAAIQPELRAIDAYNAREALVKFLLDKGVTTVHTGHGPGALASGQTMIAKTPYNTVEEAVLDSVTMVAFTLGAGISRQFSKPGTRAKGVAMLRQQFIDAEAYLEKRKSGDYSRSIRMDILADILEGRITALITANRANDIMTALRLKEEFGFRMVLDGAAEAYLLLDEIKASGVPVFIHPTMVRTGGTTQNASFETAAGLQEAGIPFAFQSGFESYVPKTRVILYEAAIAVANGLNRLDALHAMTAGTARMLGMDHRIGSIRKGKDADIVLFNGDPFEYTTHATAVIVDGKLVHSKD